VAVHDELRDAVDGRRGVDAADRLCEACVMLFNIDAAAISLVFEGATSGPLGSSSTRARVYDELQFTLGEGPCLDSVAFQAPVLISDLAAHRDDNRWPLYGPAMLDLKIRGIFAMPVALAGEYVGALDLFRAQPGVLEGDEIGGALLAAALASIPLLDFLDNDLQAAVNDPHSDAWAELGAISRADVSQATGMLVAQLDIDPAEALVRLRAHAYATDSSATEVARGILDYRIRLEKD